MRVSNLQAMAYKNSQCRDAWSGHCLSAPALAMTVKTGEGAYCVTALWKALQAWQMSCDLANVSNNRPAACGGGQKIISWRFKFKQCDGCLQADKHILHSFAAISFWSQSCCVLFSCYDCLKTKCPFCSSRTIRFLFWRTTCSPVTMGHRWTGCSVVFSKHYSHRK